MPLCLSRPVLFAGCRDLRRFWPLWRSTWASTWARPPRCAAGWAGRHNGATAVQAEMQQERVHGAAWGGSTGGMQHSCANRGMGGGVDTVCVRSGVGDAARPPALHLGPHLGLACKRPSLCRSQVASGSCTFRDCAPCPPRPITLCRTQTSKPLTHVRLPLRTACSP